MGAATLGPTPAVRGRVVTRGAGLLLAAAALALAALLSLAVGTRSIPFGDVLDALFHGGGSQDATVVRDLRVPRTLVGIAVGAALGTAGAVMQSLTRNPLADPGLLGVNAGASVAVVTAIGLLGISATTGYVWFAFLGAALAAVLVFAIGSAGRGGATPVRLALAGTATSAALIALVYGISLTDPQLLAQYNQWAVGSITGRGSDDLRAVVPFIVVGLLVAWALTPSLNALALGDDGARALGTHVGRTRAAGALVITLLCGAATAVAGPVYFLGLAVPHAARAICGPDDRWVMAYAALLGPVLVLMADVLGRIVARPGEVEAGIVIAFLGAPVFIALVRRKRIARL